MQSIIHSFKMELTILGSGSAIPYDNRASSSYILKFGDSSILLDAGFWVVERLEKIKFSLNNLEYIFLSHKHPDHFIGLIHILFALRNPVFNRETPLKIFGFKGLREYFEKFKKILGHWIEPGFEILFFEDKEKTFDKFSYSLFKTEHSEESVGINILINNKKITYTSDTDFFLELGNKINNSEIVIIECASPSENKIKGHLSYTEIMEITKNLNIKKIILTHFYPDSLPKVKLPENFILAKDLMHIKIN